MLYDFTISSGQAVSSGEYLDPSVTGLADGAACALLTPAAWTAADLLVESSVDGTNWFPVYSADGTCTRIVLDAGRIVTLDPASLWGLSWLRFRSVAVGDTSDVNQAANRTLRLIIR